MSLSIIDSGTKDSISQPQTTITSPRTLAKIDLHVVPILCIAYTASFLDRINIGNAQVFGLSTDLSLTSSQFSIALMVFFIGYILLEIPSNFVLSKTKPHIYLSACICLFGLVTLAQGFVRNYAQLCAIRVLLGVFEAGLYPGCFYLLTMWYTRAESLKRFMGFSLSSVLAGAFGGLLAGAIGRMDGHLGVEAWRWLFIIEGAGTVFVAVASYFLIPDFPEDAKWLTEDERECLKKKLELDVGPSGKGTEELRIRDLKILADYKFLTGGLMFFGLLIPAYGFSYFIPTIIKTWKSNKITVQLLTVPVWFAGWLVGMVVAAMSDRFQHRFSFMMGGMCVGAIGIIIVLLFRERFAIAYFGLYLCLVGGFSVLPISVCWFVTNLRGHKARALGTAFQTTVGNLGGMIAPFVFLDVSTSGRGYIISLGSVALTAICAIYFWYRLGKENEAMERSEAENGESGEGMKFRYMR